MTGSATATPETSTTASVFERLLDEIAGGRYASGSRLPSERDLAQRLSTSRPTLREALRRLEDWRMVEPRRGSGIVVRDVREWSLSALPAYVRLSIGRPGFALGQLVSDILALRRRVYADVLRVVGPRGPNLTEARAQLEAAWSARKDVHAFLRHDFDILRTILASSDVLPGLWLLNDLADVYFSLAGFFGQLALPPPDYHEIYCAMLDDLERADGEAAAKRLDSYLDRNDRTLVALLQTTDLLQSTDVPRVPTGDRP